MFRKIFNTLTIVALMVGFIGVAPSAAMEISENPNGGGKGGPTDVVPPVHPPSIPKGNMDQPNPIDFKRAEQRMQLLKAGKTAEANALGLSGTDRVLVLLVEFAGTDTFTWTAGTSQWDPLGIADPNEYTGVTGDCSKIITETKSFTYSGPIHNTIPRPLSEADRSGQSIWTPNFTPQWFDDFMFGNGVVISYTRQDSSQVYANFMGKSVRDFYKDLSNGAYNINGDVVGWLEVPHSTWYYGTDLCPGARSVPNQTFPTDSGSPAGKGPRDLVRDALAATNAISNTIPGFDWRNYDQNGDGYIDRLWIVHAGYGEEDGTDLLNRTTYGESAVWSHSSSIPDYVVDPVHNIKAGPYIMMPENGGIGVFAHEYGHNLGAIDLYTYGNGNTSAGFWTTMSDDWTGYPIGFEPPAQDPMHLDRWGWLNPLVVTDTSKVYTATIGQASRFPNDPNMVRGVRIELPTGQVPQPVPVWDGSYYWWGGKRDQMNSMMTTKNPINLTGATAPQLTFETAYGLETEWDFMWVQASKDGGTTWDTITNTNQTCTHASGWIGEQNGFPDDLCAARLAGFTDYNANFPDPNTETFDLSKYIGENILLRLWYMTDWGTTYEGPFVDNFVVSDTTLGTLLSDGAEAGDANWTYEPDWARSDGTKAFDHSFYLQWRNTNTNGGYDEALGDARWRYGPANTGLVVWYENQAYTDNSVENYLTDYPSYGPKGRMLVVDSQPAPYRSPFLAPAYYPNEGANLSSRGLMRDAPFTLAPTVDFDYASTALYPPGSGVTTTHFTGRTAVNVFHDSLGYYPGAEFVSRSPYQTSRWITKQWDASTVVPSKSFYALNAPGYDGFHTGSTANEFRYGCSINPAGMLGCYYYGGGTGLGYYGGNGNPADVNGQYGWHVQLVAEAGDHTAGTVRIWNSQYAVDSVLTPDETHVAIDDVIDYTASFRNAGSQMSYVACVDFDSTKLEYVPGSATGDPLLLSSCPVGTTALAPTSGAVGALAWTIDDAAPNAKADFTFQLKAIENGIWVQPTATILKIGEGASAMYTSLTSPFVEIGDWLFLPAIQK